MKKNISCFLALLLVINNLLVPRSVYAALSFDMQNFSIKVNWWTAQSGDINANPWDTLSIAIWWENNWDSATNVLAQFDFSATEFVYTGVGTVDSYKWWTLENQNIDTNNFNPPTDNTVPITSSSVNGDVLDLYYTQLLLNSNVSTYNFTIWAKFTADSYAWSNQIVRNIYVNVKPHITDWYFEKSWLTTSSIKNNWTESIDLIVKVKDYNWCSNIDWWTVTADLFDLWMQTNESLIYQSCDSPTNTATYKKSWITTLVATWSISFWPSKFTATDENSNQDDYTDTKFNSIDKTDSISLAVQPWWASDVTLVSLSDNYIWWSSQTSATLTFSWSQDWDYKVVLNWDTSCSSGTVITNWSSYTSQNSQGVSISSAVLNAWSNTIYVCIRNINSEIWSINTNITNDTTSPTLSNFLISPANVTSNNSSLSFDCSENWTYKVCLDQWTTTCQTTIQDWASATANNTITTSVTNALLSLWANTIHSWCQDNAWNQSSQTWSIAKQQATPSMTWWITSFSDSDIDYNWLDGRDISVSWLNTTWVDFSWFESWRIYILPSNVDLDSSTHIVSKTITSSSTSSWTWIVSLTTDSVWNSFVNWGSYKVYVAIMWTSWELWQAAVSSATTLTSDTVTNATILSAEFTSGTNLELTTDTTVHTTLSSHSGALVQFDVWWTTYTWYDVWSVDWTKINITISSLSNTASTWSSLIVFTWAIRSGAWGFNNYFSSWSLIISDAQVPTITSFTKSTSAWYSIFYSGSISFWYTFSEDMESWWSTYIEFTRTWWNADSTIHVQNLTIPSDLTSWVKTNSVDLSTISLTCGSTYQVRVYWQDISNNVWSSSYITWIAYDECWPTAPTLTNLTTSWTWDVVFSWTASTDDSWNWAWVKDYTLKVFSWSSCSTLINSYTWQTWTSATKTLTNWNYSWNLVAIDNMYNTWTTSSCDDFTVNTQVPTISNSSIIDTTISSSLYAKSTDTIRIQADILNTDSSHIWLNAQNLAWSATYNNVLCSIPWTVNISCTYSAWTVTYEFPIWFAWALTDGSKQVVLSSQNTSWLNDQTKNLSITVDNTSPSVWASVITAPNGWEVWWASHDITWTTSQVTDAIWLNYIRLEYQTWAGAWFLIITWANSWSYSWDMSSLSAWVDYKVRLIAYDLVWNSANDQSDAVFTIDQSPPTVWSSVLSTPNWAEILSWWQSYNITWNNGAITDDLWFWSQPISLEYSINWWTSYTTISSSQANDGSYTWTVPSLSTTQGRIKLTATDFAWNTGVDISDTNFIIDSTLPTVTVTYTTDTGSTPPNWSEIWANWFDVSVSSSDSYINKVYYKFKNQTDNDYWDNATSTRWSAIRNLICSDTTTSWSAWNCASVTTGIVATLEDWESYNLIFKTTDEAGNEKESVLLDYVADLTIPSVSISTVSWSYFSGSATITWTWSDSWAWISSVVLQIMKWANYWNWSSYQAWQYSIATTTSNDYANWSYTFDMTWADSEWQAYTVTSIITDNAYTIWNTWSSSITIYKDTVWPVIVSGWFWTTPAWWDLVKWWDVMNIQWTNGNITDATVGLASNPIQIEYYNWSSWVSVATSELNDGSYNWTIPSVNVTTAYIRITAFDSIWNSTTITSNAFTIDSWASIISSSSTMDQDTDWQIDWFYVVMNENINDSTILTWNFSANLWISLTTASSASSVNDNIFVLSFNNTWTTATSPILSYTQGSLADIVWNLMVTTWSVVVTDGASPRLLTWEFYDIDSDGRLDQIKAYFSENINSTTNTSAWTIDNALAWISVSSVSVSSNIATITISEPTSFNTSTWGMTLDFTSNSNWTDWINQAWSKTDLTIIDDAIPKFVSYVFSDWDSDYKTDTVTIMLSESVTSFSSWDFSLSWLGTWSSYTDGSISTNTITLTVSETSSNNDTAITPTFTYTPGSLQDSAWNSVLTASNIAISDWVSPKILSRLTQDTDWNWFIDQILITVSETLDHDYTSFVWMVSWYTVTGYTWSTTNIKINVSEKSVIDSADTPWVKISSNSTLSDNTENNMSAEWSFVTPTDGVWPVLIGARYDEWGAWVTDDTIILTFSEVLTAWTISSDPSNDFVISGWWAFAWSSSMVYGWWTSATITMWAWATALTPWTSKIWIKTSAIQDSNWIGSPTQWSSNQVIVSHNVVINEVMFASTQSSQYIELRNLWTSSVDISNWVIQNAWWNGINITISWWEVIGAWWYYLIAQSVAWSSVLNISPDYVDASINLNSDSQNNIVLTDGSSTYDTVLAGPRPDWDKTVPKSMERLNNPWLWTDWNNWYTSVVSSWFDNSTPYWTPWSANVFDGTSPTISAYSPSNNVLLPVSPDDISYVYADNSWWVWINISSASLLLEKWNWTSYDNVTATYVGTWTIWNTTASYPISSLVYGKYRATFTISDNSSNSQSQVLVFYVDKFEISIDTNNKDFWAVQPWTQSFSSEITVIVKTLWAWFNFIVDKDSLLSALADSIPNWNWSTWFGFDYYMNENWTETNYDSSYQAISSNTISTVASWSIDVNWAQKTYTYKLKFNINIDSVQPVGNYSTNVTINVWNMSY